MNVFFCTLFAILSFVHEALFWILNCEGRTMPMDGAIFLWRNASFCSGLTGL